MSALALIEDGLANINTIVDIEKGHKKFYDRTMHDSENHDMTEVTLKKCFEKSSNVGFAKLIDYHYQHNPQKFLDRIHAAGLDEPLGFEIKGEGKPFIKHRKDKTWSGVTLPWMAIGYEMTMTPLQILAFYNAVANDGKMVKPYIVEKIQRNGVTVDSFGTTVLRENICSENTAKQLRSMLEGVVQEGTATNVKNAHYNLAGKTGTAKVLDKEFGYKQKTAYQASFCGYFPAENPRYSCVVVISSPSTGLFYGSKVAAPVFKEVADKIYATSFDMHPQVNSNKKIIAENFSDNYKGYHTDMSIVGKVMALKNIAADDDAEWTAVKKQASRTVATSIKYAENFIPDVTGMGLRDALYLLESKGLKVKVVGKGMVEKQSLQAGNTIEKGQEIIIELS
jgi:cell division protein FtsI (penicillin-binding protein 3)